MKVRVDNETDAHLLWVKSQAKALYRKQYFVFPAPQNNI